MNPDNKQKRAEYLKKWHLEHPNYNKEKYLKNKDYHNEKSKKYRQDNPQKVKQLWEEWYKNNKQRSPKRRLTEAKHTAKRRKIEWSLSLEEYSNLISQPCYYCENKLGEVVKRSIGLDRIDSDQGYHIFNVVSCCYTCNCIKNKFLTQEETLVAVKAILLFRNNKNNL